MKRNKNYCLTSILLFLFILVPLSVSGQLQLIPLQRVVFTDTKVEEYLRYLVSKTKPDFMAITIEIDSVDNGYIYSASPIREYESVEKFRSPNWGKWGNQVILFYGRVDLKPICRIVGTTGLENLQHFAKTRLPRGIVTVPGTKTQEMRFSKEPFMDINFKLIKGREVYYYDSSGYDTRVVLNELPSVPETSKKQ